MIKEYLELSLLTVNYQIINYIIMINIAIMFVIIIRIRKVCLEILKNRPWTCLSAIYLRKNFAKRFHISNFLLYLARHTKQIKTYCNKLCSQSTTQFGFIFLFIYLKLILINRKKMWIREKKMNWILWNYTICWMEAIKFINFIFRKKNNKFVAHCLQSILCISIIYGAEIHILNIIIIMKEYHFHSI